LWELTCVRAYYDYLVIRDCVHHLHTFVGVQEVEEVFFSAAGTER